MARKLRVVPHVRVAELAVVLMIAVFLGLAVMYSLYVQHDVANMYDAAAHDTFVAATGTRQLTYADTAKLYQVTYPSNWHFMYLDPPTEGVSPLVDWTKVSRTVTLWSPSAPQAARSTSTIQVQPKATVQAWLAQSRKDTFHTVTAITIGKSDGYLDRVVFTGPSGAERYTDDYYYVFHGANVVVFAFRESYYHNYPAADWSNVRNLPAFQAIVNSITFLR